MGDLVNAAQEMREMKRSDIDAYGAPWGSFSVDPFRSASMLPPPDKLDGKPNSAFRWGWTPQAQRLGAVDSSGLGSLIESPAELSN